jgi:hypothetical protein
LTPQPADSPQSTSPDVAALRQEFAALRADFNRLATAIAADVASLRADFSSAFTPTGVLARLAPVGNPHDLGLVVVTSSGLDLDPRWTAKNAVDRSPAGFWSQDHPNQWLCVDFKSLAITPTEYILRSIHEQSGSVHPRGWILEGSSDGISWTELDHREDNNDLNRPNTLVTFPVALIPLSRMVRIRQTQKNHHGTDVLALAYFDIIGTLSAAPV